MTNILIEGDMHCGSHLGLTPPDHMGEWAWALDPLWRWREEQLALMPKIDIHVLNADLIDGPGKKDSLGLFTTDTRVQRGWAIEAIERVAAGRRFFSYGSNYHVTSTYEAETDIAEHFGASIEDELLLRVSGLRLSVRHFIGRSDVPTGFGNQDAREIVRALIQEATDGREAADVFIRSHVHYWSRVDIKDKIAITCPAWQLNLSAPGSAFPRGLRTQYYDVGMVLIQVDQHGEAYIRRRVMPLKIAYPREYIDVSSP